MRTVPSVLIILLLLMLSPIARAQRVHVSEGVSLSAVESFEPLGKLGGYYLMTTFTDDKLRLRAYDGSMRGYFDRELKLGDISGVEVLDVSVADGAVWVYYSHRIRAQTVVRLHKYDASGMMLDTAELFRVGDRFFTPDISVKRSWDGKFAALHTVTPQDQWVIKVVEQDSLAVKAEHVVTSGSKWNDDDMFMGLEIGGSGEIFVARDFDNYHSVREKHRYEVSYLPLSGTVVKLEIVMQGNLSTDATFLVDSASGQLVVVGLYGTENHSRSEGYWIAHLEPGQSGRISPNYQPFTLPFCRSMENSEQRDSSVADLRISKAVFRRDGGLVMMLERSKDVNRIAAANRTIYNSANQGYKDFYREQVGVISTKPDSKTEWQTVLYKKQFSYDDDAAYSSFGLVRSSGQLQLIFNDEINENATVSAFQVKNTGAAVRQTLFSNQGQDILIMMKYLVQTGLNEVVAPSIYQNKLRLVKIVF
jgi:hypothetical protein